VSLRVQRLSLTFSAALSLGLHACGGAGTPSDPDPPATTPPNPARLPLQRRVSVTPSPARRVDAAEIEAANLDRAALVTQPSDWEWAFVPPRGALRFRVAAQEPGASARATARVRNIEAVEIPSGLAPVEPYVRQATRSLSVSLAVAAVADAPAGYAAPVSNPASHFAVVDHGCEEALVNRVQRGLGDAREILQASGFCDVVVEFSGGPEGVYLADLTITLQEGSEEQTQRLLLLGRAVGVHPLLPSSGVTP
jgi:hypothetical protein